jgi:hypothetical protein
MVVGDGLGGYPAEEVPKWAWDVPVVLVADVFEDLRLSGDGDPAVPG